jgi:hypothetical protein
VSTYPPRRCGIATFTLDLATATGSREIVALHPPEQAAPYPIVKFRDGRSKATLELTAFQPTE